MLTAEYRQPSQPVRRESLRNQKSVLSAKHVLSMDCVWCSDCYTFWYETYHISYLYACRSLVRDSLRARHDSNRQRPVLPLPRDCRDSNHGDSGGGIMKRYRMSFGNSINHKPEHPERTARRSPFNTHDVEFGVWSSEGAMKTTMTMQASGPHSADHWMALHPRQGGQSS